MKFKFCGGLDCPEWLISEIFYLNKINSVKLRIITSHIATIITNKSNDYSKIIKLLEEIDFSNKEIHIIIAIIHFILKYSSKFEVDSITLNQELQMLGIPQENIDSIVKVYKSNELKMRAVLIEDIFKFSELEDFKWKISIILASNSVSFDKVTIEKLKEDEETKMKIENNPFPKKVIINLKNKNYEFSKEMLGLMINEIEKGLNLISINHK